jgi:ElaA protein
MNRIWKSWADITRDELYEMLKLRQDIFIIEQACIYPELDDVDQGSTHLLVRDGQGGLVACLRVVAPGARYEEPSIGRLVVRQDERGRGLARELMTEAIAKCHELYPSRSIRIQAQKYLEKFYASLGFKPIGQPYDEAGIMHVDMVLNV